MFIFNNIKIKPAKISIALHQSDERNAKTSVEARCELTDDFSCEWKQVINYFYDFMTFMTVI